MDLSSSSSPLLFPLILIISGYVVVFVSSFFNDENALSAQIGGYIAIVVSLVLLVLMKSQQFGGFGEAIMKSNMCSSTLTILVLFVFVIYLLWKYFDKIANNHVSSVYLGFNKLSTILLAIQMYYITRTAFGTSTTTTANTTTNRAIVAFLAIINFFVISIMAILLHYYTTQG